MPAGLWLSQVEHRTLNPAVGGSNPPRPAYPSVASQDVLARYPPATVPPSCGSYLVATLTGQAISSPLAPEWRGLSLMLHQQAGAQHGTQSERAARRVGGRGGAAAVAGRRCCGRLHAQKQVDGAAGQQSYPDGPPTARRRCGRCGGMWGRGCGGCGGRQSGEPTERWRRGASAWRGLGRLRHPVHIFASEISGHCPVDQGAHKHGRMRHSHAVGSGHTQTAS